MKKAIFIWQPSPIFISSITDGGPRKVKAVQFCKELNECIEDQQLDWQVELDDTNADIYEIVEKEFDLLIFTPGGKTRFFMPKELKEQLKDMPKLYLESLEYHNQSMDKVVECMDSIASEKE